MDTKFSRADRPFVQDLPVMQSDPIGDGVMASPVLRTLKEAVPQAEITETSVSNLRKDICFLDGLRKRRFAMAVIFSRVSQLPERSAYDRSFAGIPHQEALTRDDEGSALSHLFVPPTDGLHPLDQNRNLLEAIGNFDGNNPIDLIISQGTEKTANDLLDENGIRRGSPYLVFAAEASLAADCYDPDHFAAVARILAAQTELQLLVVGSSAEMEAAQPLLQVANENIYGNVHSLVGKTTLPELSVVIRQARLTITSRSAVVHLADRFRCLMVMLYPEPDSRYGMNSLDIGPEEIAIAALELLEERTYSSGTYQVLQEYRSDPSEI